MAQTAVLLVKNLHKEYSRGRPRCLGLKRSDVSSGTADSKKVAIDDSSFAVDAGEIFGLLGPNGAGKSTTLNAIIAETQPTSGQVSFSCVPIGVFFKKFSLRDINHRLGRLSPQSHDAPSPSLFTLPVPHFFPSPFSFPFLPFP